MTHRSKKKKRERDGGGKRRPETDKREGPQRLETGAVRLESMKGNAKWDMSLKMGRVLEAGAFENGKRKEMFKTTEDVGEGEAAKQIEKERPPSSFALQYYESRAHRG